MVRKDGLVKILDFGIAKLTEQEKPDIESEDKTAVQVNTTPGMIIGTANYMSPEQAKGKNVDARTDIFSFGVVLYEMITGHLPFSGDSPLEIIASILNKEPKPIEIAKVPAEVERVINKTLRKDRNERYQTIKDLIIDLRDAKEDLKFQDKLDKTIQPNRNEQNTQAFKATTASEADQTTAPGTNDSITIKKSGLGKAVAVFLAVLLVAAIGLGYWFLASGSSGVIESIAVMPFVNESGSEDVEYLSDGMTETLIASLSKLPNLQVKPRSSVFRYKGKNTDTKTIGEELNVQAILNGRVVRRGEQLILSLELVDAEKEIVVWSERYDRKQSELVSLQKEIAKDVSVKLRSRLSGEDEEKVTSTGTSNPEAYQSYLKGRYFWNKRLGDNLEKAIGQFKTAADNDPNYALAYTGLADCYALLPDYKGASISESTKQARKYAERAIALDSLLGEPHATLGFVNFLTWKWEDAEREFKRAIELSPNYATAYQWYAALLATLGRVDEGRVMISRAHELDPLSMIVGSNVSVYEMLKRNYDASIKNSRKMIELDPDFPYPYITLGLSLLEKGRVAEGIANLEKAAELTEKANVELASLGYAYGVTGERAKAVAIAKEAEQQYSRRESSGLFIAMVYVGLGDKDKAFEWLEKNFEDGGDLGRLRREIAFDSIRDDPRYKDLLKRMGLPE
jgi:TolB-like protein/Flp pilus assembly protein TadD